ncbi:MULTISPECIES: ALF repeat-containing protein [unclassified Streptomyces]|uniref:ALF repeat-containing protein n=1 Tax=unclassified Streptomyces TaxID=2593676 RepID=UPI00036C79D6|nr:MULTISPECIES: ALF repeat-containing protein [unclassified Streptomyces]MYY05323.1 hypothetical protein [Streptomyces sp. SID4913]
MRLTRVALTAAATALAPALLLSGPAFAAGTASPSTATAASAPAGHGSDIPVDDMSDDDVRVAVVRLLADPASGKRVVKEVNALLDANDPAQMREWLKTGYPLAQAEDDRVALVRILGNPASGKRVVKEVNALLDANDPAQMREWLETGYRLAQAEDDSVALFRMLGEPDISDAMRAAVIEAIQGTPEEMRYFLEYGQYEVDA